MDELISLAKAIATDAHAGQVDKAGAPYVGHLARVASYADQGNCHAVMAAWLHDTVEDTELTAEDLIGRGVPEDVVATIVLLTRRDDQTPVDYYAQIRDNAAAREVKLADLADNSDPERLSLLSDEDRGRLERKYASAYRALDAEVGDGQIRRSRARA